MDAVTLALAKKHTNEQVIQKATNSPTETISFDCGAYSLPSTVVNGQVSDVVVKGNTLQDIDNQLINIFSTAPVDYEQGSILGSTGAPAASENVIRSKDFKFIKPLTTYSLVLDTSYKVAVFCYESDGTYIKAVVSVWSFGNITFQTPINATKIKYAFIKEPVEAMIPSDIANVRPLLKEGNTILNGTKSTNSVRVKSVGKNLCPTSQEAWKQGLLTTTSGIPMGSKTNIYTPGYYLIPQGKISCSQKNKLLYVLFYDENKNFISSSSRLDITVPVNAKYARFRIYSSDDDITPSMVTTFEPQCEQGTTASPYEPYKESSVIINLPEPLRSVPSANDEVNVTSGVKKQNVSDEYIIKATDISSISNRDNFTQARIDFSVFPISPVNGKSDKQGTFRIEGWTEKSNTPLGSYIPNLYATREDNVLWFDLPLGTTLEQARTALTGLTLTYQLAEPIVTKLPAQPPLQVFENGTVYVEPIGDPAESTVPSVEMTIPTGNSNKFGVASHDYDGAAADWVLTNSESKCFLLAVSNAGGSANIIAPDAPGVMYAISNDSGQTITVKISGGSGVEVVDSKTVLVIHNGTDYTALTAEL